MLDASTSDRASRLMRQLEARYTFEAVLGRGGSGVVFEVENRQLGRREALKLLGQTLNRDDAPRFVHEAKIMAALDHPHIVPIYAFGETAGCLWYSMKLVEGPTLGKFLQVVPRCGVSEACRLAIPMLEALVLSHSRGIIHRDIKPANILLDATAGPLLTDFGIAKTEGDPMRTETGLVLGTPAYVSPEQSLGQKLDGRTDLYALAVSLYQLLTGRLPFEEGNSLAIMLQRFQADAVPLATHRPDLPPVLARLVDRGMARQPEDRFASAQKMLEAFQALAAAEQIDAQQPLSLPAGLAVRREPLPAELTWATKSEATGASPTVGRLAANAPTQALSTREAPRSTDASRRRWLWAGFTLVALSTSGFGLWKAFQPRRTASPMPTQVAPVQTEPAPSLLPPAASGNRTEAAALPARPALEPPLVRRPVTPPMLLETPKVLLPEGSPCGGRTIPVEVQVDEAGTVSSAGTALGGRSTLGVSRSMGVTGAAPAAAPGRARRRAAASVPFPEAAGGSRLRAAPSGRCDLGGHGRCGAAGLGRS